MRTLHQIAEITLLNLRTLPARLGTSLVVVVGIAGVVGVLVSVLAMSEGFRHTLASTGRPDRVILLRAGSDAELSSGVPRDAATLLSTLPGVARDPGGRPLASAELVVMVDLPRQGETEPNNVPFRGVQPTAFAVRDELRIVEGRRLRARRPGGDRGPKGRAAVRGPRRRLADRVPGQRLDGRRHLRDRRRRPRVGDLERYRGHHVGVPARRDSSRSPPGSRTARRRVSQAFKDSVSRDPRFSISVLREPEYYAKQATVLSRPDQRARLHGSRVHGRRRHVRRAELHVLGHRQPAGRDRHAPRHRFRRPAGGGLGDDRGTRPGGPGRGGGRRARLRLLRRRLPVHAQLQHLLPGGLRFPRHAGPCSRRASCGRSASALAGGLLPAVRAARLPVTEALRTG